jgi:hypothetical protein
MDTSQATVPGQRLQNLPELMKYGFLNECVCVFVFAHSKRVCVCKFSTDSKCAYWPGCYDHRQTSEQQPNHDRYPVFFTRPPLGSLFAISDAGRLGLFLRYTSVSSRYPCHDESGRKSRHRVTASSFPPPLLPPPPPCDVSPWQPRGPSDSPRPVF